MATHNGLQVLLGDSRIHGGPWPLSQRLHSSSLVLNGRALHGGLSHRGCSSSAAPTFTADRDSIAAPDLPWRLLTAATSPNSHSGSQPLSLSLCRTQRAPKLVTGPISLSPSHHLLFLLHSSPSKRRECQAHLPPNFHKLLLLQLKKLTASGKLTKVKNSYKLPIPISLSPSLATCSLSSSSPFSGVGVAPKRRVEGFPREHGSVRPISLLPTLSPSFTLSSHPSSRSKGG